MKNCKNCKHLLSIGTELSPGGMMFVQNYKCDNKLSEKFNNKMNVVTSMGHSIDSTEKNTCDNYELI